jgi:hypothetical protein
MAAKDSITINQRVPRPEDGKLLAAVMLKDLSESNECADEPKGREILLRALNSFVSLTDIERTHFVEVLHDYLSCSLAGVSMEVEHYFDDDWKVYRE